MGGRESGTERGREEESEREGSSGRLTDLCEVLIRPWEMLSLEISEWTDDMI